MGCLYKRIKIHAINFVSPHPNSPHKIIYIPSSFPRQRNSRIRGRLHFRCASSMLLLGWSWYVNHELVLEDLMRQLKLVVVLLAVHFLSGDSIHRAGGGIPQQTDTVTETRPLAELLYQTKPKQKLRYITTKLKESEAKFGNRPKEERSHPKRNGRRILHCRMINLMINPS